MFFVLVFCFVLFLPKIALFLLSFTTTKRVERYAEWKFPKAAKKKKNGNCCLFYNLPGNPLLFCSFHHFHLLKILQLYTQIYEIHTHRPAYIHIFNHWHSLWALQPNSAGAIGLWVTQQKRCKSSSSLTMTFSLFQILFWTESRRGPSPLHSLSSSLLIINPSQDKVITNILTVSQQPYMQLCCMKPRLERLATHHGDCVHAEQSTCN